MSKTGETNLTSQASETNLELIYQHFGIHLESFEDFLSLVSVNNVIRNHLESQGVVVQDDIVLNAEDCIEILDPSLPRLKFKNTIDDCMMSITKSIFLQYNADSLYFFRIIGPDDVSYDSIGNIANNNLLKILPGLGIDYKGKSIIEIRHKMMNIECYDTKYANNSFASVAIIVKGHTSIKNNIQNNSYCDIYYSLLGGQLWTNYL